MLVSPARRRFGLDSTGRGGAPSALVTLFALEDNQSSASARTHPLNVVRSGRQPIVALEPNPSPDRAPTVLGADCGTTEIGTGA